MIQERDECLGKLFTKSLTKRIESSSLEFLSVKSISNVFNGYSLFSVCDLTNFRANECRAKLVRAMPSAAENH